MTMAASLRFSGGVVLCADQLHTKGTADAMFASYACKLRLFEEWAFSAILTGAGEHHIISAVEDNVFERLSRAQERYQNEYFLASERVKPAFEAALSDVYANVMPPEGATILLAVNSYDSGIQTFKAEGKIPHLADSLEIIGIGDNSLLGLLRDSLFSGPLITRQEATAVLSLLAFAAKKYCPLYCGGKTDIACLVNREHFSFQEPQETIAKMESLFAKQLYRSFDSLISQAMEIVAK